MRKAHKIILCALLVVLLAALLAVTVSAEAEAEGVFYDECELLQDGGFPSPPEAELSLDSRALTNKQQAEEAILAGLESSHETIILSSYGLNESELKTVYSGILNSNPQFFYVERRWGYTQSDSKVLTVKPQYSMSGTELTTAKTAYNSYIDEIIDPIKDNDWTEIEKALYIHDYLAVNYEYDNDLEIYDAYTFFKEKTGVCQSYTLAYIALLKELNMQITFASSESMNHIWNVVNIDDVWYHVDVTWDDPTKDMLGRACHNNFLLSDTGIAKTKHSNWTSAYPCTTDTYDSFYWQGVTTAFVPIGESWYYLSYSYPNLTIKKTGDVEAVSTETVKTVNTYWPAGGSSYYTSHYSGLSVYYGRLIYNTPTHINYYAPVGGDSGEIDAPTLVDGNHIFGSTLIGNTLYYGLDTSPNERATRYQLTLTSHVTLKKIEIQTPPDITVFAVGEALDTHGLSLLLTYSDNSTETKNSGFTLSPEGPLTLGTKTITVTYENKTTTYDITVKEQVDWDSAASPVILFPDGQVRLKKGAAASGVSVYCAAYTGLGRLLGVCTLSESSDTSELVQIPNAANADKFKVFSLNSSYVPTAAVAVGTPKAP